MLAEQLEIVVQCSETIGKGHLMRCLAIAEQARSRELETVMVAYDDNTWKWLKCYADVVNVTTESKPSKWRIRDTATTNDPDVVKQEADAGTRVLLMDDKGPARCNASIVMDAMMTSERAKLLPHNNQTTYCYGLEFTPIRAAIRDYAGTACPGTQNRILIALGFGFPDNYVLNFCQALMQLDCNLIQDILVPQASPELELMKKESGISNIFQHVNQEDIGQLLNKVDLVVTKLGMTQLEAFATGVGCLVVEPGEAHLDVQQALANEYGSWPAVECGLAESVTPEELAQNTLQILADRSALQVRGRRASELVDARGCERIVDELMKGAA